MISGFVRFVLKGGWTMIKSRSFPVPILFVLMLLLLPFRSTEAASIEDLILAVWEFDTAKAAALIDGGVEVNGKDSKGTYPLLLACGYENNDEMIKLLLEKGADPNIFGPNGNTPLGLATRRSFEAVKMLVENGADVNAKHEKGKTALWWAQRMEEPEIVDYLKENGAKE